MQNDVAARRSQAGFSLLEVVAVVAIGLIVTAVTLPRMSNIIANMKVRSSMTTVSGLLQNTRQIAVKENKTKVACHYNWSTPPYSLVFFVKDATDCTGLTAAATDPQVELQAPITAMDAPTGSGAPGKVPYGQLGLSADPPSGDPSFNSRGIPCAYAAGNCPNTAFITYFKDNRITSPGGWAAISISPAGRINRWFYNGSSWTN